MTKLFSYAALPRFGFGIATTIPFIDVLLVTFCQTVGKLPNDNEFLTEIWPKLFPHVPHNIVVISSLLDRKCCECVQDEIYDNFTGDFENSTRDSDTDTNDEYSTNFTEKIDNITTKSNADFDEQEMTPIKCPTCW